MVYHKTLLREILGVSGSFKRDQARQNRKSVKWIHYSAMKLVGLNIELFAFQVTSLHNMHMIRKLLVKISRAHFLVWKRVQCPVYKRLQMTVCHVTNKYKERHTVYGWHRGKDKRTRGNKDLAKGLHERYFWKNVDLKGGLESFRCRHSLTRKGRELHIVGQEKGKEHLNFSCLMRGSKQRSAQADRTDSVGWRQ